MSEIRTHLNHDTNSGFVIKVTTAKVYSRVTTHITFNAGGVCTEVDLGNIKDVGALRNALSEALELM